jgi:homoserine O-acetyltransferase/O-succinyltransferase
MTPAVRRGSFTARNFELESGAVLPEITIAYVAIGTLSADGTNAVLVEHGFTSGPDMILPNSSIADGTWGALIGAGKAIDTDRYFVICPNMLGSSFGSTNAASINPLTGRPWGPDFPGITMRDVVRSQRLLLDDLGIRRLAAVAGPSFGGMQTFQWGVTYPEFMNCLVPVHASLRPPPADIDQLTNRLAADPRWNGGRYYETGGVEQTLRKMRAQMLKSFSLDEVLAPSFPNAADRAHEIDRLAAGWAAHFDANSLLILMKAALAYDVRADLTHIRAPVLFVLSSSDPLFPPSIAPDVMTALRAANVRAEYEEIESAFGHSASSVEPEKWAPRLRAFIDDANVAVGSRS